MGKMDFKNKTMIFPGYHHIIALSITWRNKLTNNYKKILKKYALPSLS